MALLLQTFAALPCMQLRLRSGVYICLVGYMSYRLSLLALPQVSAGRDGRWVARHPLHSARPSQ